MTARQPSAPDGTRHTDIDPAGRTPEPAFGTDEEGEAQVTEPAVTDDAQSWVHVEKRR